LRGRLKWGEGDLALITAHAKLGIDNGGAGKGFDLPMKGMAKRTLNIHLPETMELPSRVKWPASNGKRLWWLSSSSWLVKRRMIDVTLVKCSLKIIIMAN
jgi:hypothetical protein